MDKYSVKNNVTIKQAMKRIDQAASKTIFVVDHNLRLIGSLSDGDVRRAILNGIELSINITKVMNSKPLYFNEGYDLDNVKKVFLEKLIEAVPVVNEDKRIVDVLLWNNVFKKEKKAYKQLDIPVVIMAGGKGTRLDPFTRILPKPLIPIGDKPIVEVIMDEYAKFGINNFLISINHKGKMIKAYFEEHKSNYKFEYIEEDKPLGTAGSLRLIKDKIKTPFFVSNCDIIIKDDYFEIYDFHKSNKNILTIVASMQQYIVPYGVCEIENGGKLKILKEKPQYDLLANTGMYIINTEALDLIPEEKFFHITHLIEKLQKNSYKIGVYPVSEKSWIDVGQWGEFRKAVERMKV